MNIELRKISEKYCEVMADAIESGVMNKSEALDMAVQMLSVAEDILHFLGNERASDRCANIIEMLETGRDQNAA